MHIKTETLAIEIWAYLFTSLDVRRVATEIFRVQIFKVRLSHRNGYCNSEAGIVYERHVVAFLNSILYVTFHPITRGDAALLQIVFSEVDGHRSVIGQTVFLAVAVEVIEGFLFI